jgi:hypothetical protein
MEGRDSVVGIATYLLTFLLTPCSRVLLEKLTGSAASQEIPRIFGTRKLITVFTSARHMSLSWANSIQSPQPRPTSWRFTLILSSHLIATRYVMESPGFETWWERDFPHLSRPALVSTQPPIQRVPGISRGYAGRGMSLTTYPHLAQKLKKEYSYTSTSPLGLHGLLQWPLPLFFKKQSDNVIELMQVVTNSKLLGTQIYNLIKKLIISVSALCSQNGPSNVLGNLLCIDMWVFLALYSNYIPLFVICKSMLQSANPNFPQQSPFHPDVQDLLYD